jgi:hypothetical protein
MASSEISGRRHVVEDWETLRARIQRQVIPEDQVWETLRQQTAGEVEPEPELEQQEQEPASRPITPLEPNPQISDREELQHQDEQTFTTQVAPASEPEVEVREAPSPSSVRGEILRMRIGPKAEAEGNDQETPTPRVTAEPPRNHTSAKGERQARFERTFGNFLSLVFGMIGMLVALQLFNWLRLRELEISGKQLENRPSTVQEALRKDLEKGRAALDQTNQKMAALNQAYQQMVAKHQANNQAIPRSAETVNQREKAATQVRPKQAEPNQNPAAKQESISNAGAGPQPDLHHSPATAQSPVSQDVPVTRQEPSTTQADVQATHQAPYVIEGDVGATRRDSLATQKAPPDKTANYLAKLIVPDPPVARDHDEIQRLRTLGDRDYFEFMLVRSNARQEIVPGISLQLKKVDVRNLRCTLHIFADDYELPDTQGINERVSFPIRAGWQSVEIVINQVKQNWVVGYVSALKGVLAPAR